MALPFPRFKSQITTSYSYTMLAMLPKGGERPNKIAILYENIAYWSYNSAAFVAIAWIL